MPEADLKLVQRVTGPSGLTATVAYDPTDGQFWVGRKDTGIWPIADTKERALHVARDLVSAGAREGGLFSPERKRPTKKRKAPRARRAKKPARARRSVRRGARRGRRKSLRGFAGYEAAQAWCRRHYRAGAKRRACVYRRTR